MIEDQLTDAQLVQHALKSDGFSFSFKRVDNAACFAQQLDAFRPSLILSDHGLPAFDGFSALAIAREKAPSVPFIFVTGSLGEEMTIQALKSGATDFVLKHRLKTLGAAVHRALTQAEHHRKRQIAEAEIRELNMRLEQRVLARTAELEAANKELEAFSYSVSHDLRAPLRHVEGFVEILKSTKAHALDEEAQRYLGTISDAARQMGRLIDDLLNFSRTARAELKKARMSLATLVQDAIKDVSTDLAGRKIQWKVGALPEVCADRSLMRQVFLNLVGNALKYTRTRDVAIIKITAESTTTEDIVHIQDNGVGFDMRYAGKLFTVFQRLHRAADFEGTGVGLANVRRIVHRHGGRTWAEGKLGQGATFSFTLPRVEPPTPVGDPKPRARRKRPSKR